MLSWIIALCSQKPHIMLWHAGIHIHFVVLVEPQSSENCAFFVLASGHKYNKIHEYRRIPWISPPAYKPMLAHKPRESSNITKLHRTSPWA